MVWLTRGVSYVLNFSTLDSLQETRREAAGFVWNVQKWHLSLYKRVGVGSAAGEIFWKHTPQINGIPLENA